MNTNWVRALRTAMVLAQLTAVTGLASAGDLDLAFDPADFSPGTAITNPYWPLVAGTAFVYSAQSDEGCAVNRVRVTGDTKADFTGEYSSIVAWEVEDKEWLDPQCSGNYALMETTLDWFAQDNAGNVWYLGEDTTAFDHEDECPSAAGAWEAGKDGAVAGVVMLAAPRVGDSYRQEFFEGEAEDQAKILRVDAPVSIGIGDFAGCLKTKEWSALEHGAVEHKYYCPEGGGLMLVEELHGKTVRVELTGNTLPSGTFAEVGVCPH